VGSFLTAPSTDALLHDGDEHLAARQPLGEAELPTGCYGMARQGFSALVVAHTARLARERERKG
jgi:hypothetical protein